MLTLFASVNLSNPSYDKATIINKLFLFYISIFVDLSSWQDEWASDTLFS